jgi:predicted transcriptional regulator
MNNAVEKYRNDHGLTYAELGRLTGYTRATVLKHCRGDLSVAGKAAVRYHARLGIPLTSLCPDLFKEGAENAA